MQVNTNCPRKVFPILLTRRRITRTYIHEIWNLFQDTHLIRDDVLPVMCLFLLNQITRDKTENKPLAKHITLKPPTPSVLTMSVSNHSGFISQIWSLLPDKPWFNSCTGGRGISPVVITMSEIWLLQTSHRTPSYYQFRQPLSAYWKMSTVIMKPLLSFQR